MRTSTRVGSVLGVAGAGVEAGVVSGDSVVVVVPNSVLGAVVPGASPVIVVELGVVAVRRDRARGRVVAVPASRRGGQQSEREAHSQVAHDTSLQLALHRRAEFTPVPGPNVKNRPTASPRQIRTGCDSDRCQGHDHRSGSRCRRRDRARRHRSVVVSDAGPFPVIAVTELHAGGRQRPPVDHG